MKKIINICAISIFGGLGWWLGDVFGMMGSFGFSILGSSVGVIVAWKVNQLAGR